MLELWSSEWQLLQLMQLLQLLQLGVDADHPRTRGRTRDRFLYLQSAAGNTKERLERGKRFHVDCNDGWRSTRRGYAPSCTPPVPKAMLQGKESDSREQCGATRWDRCGGRSVASQHVAWARRRSGEAHCGTHVDLAGGCDCDVTVVAVTVGVEQQKGDTFPFLLLLSGAAAERGSSCPCCNVGTTGIVIPHRWAVSSVRDSARRWRWGRPSTASTEAGSRQHHYEGKTWPR